ncbi:MAG: ABC transporter substrate-binding protein [Proteobacteria bacterium]|nr:ABC transporter substrate-binding protein [Pseudomonadota bacterium]
MKRSALALAAGLVLLGGPAMAQTLRIGISEDVDLLDPTQGRTLGGRIVFAGLCDKLFDIDDKLAIVPQLALSHSVAADGKTVTIQLRRDVKFHDGTPLDAAAVKFNLERQANLNESARKAEIRAIAAVKAVDAQTVELTLSQPSAPLLSQFTDRAGMMVSPKAASALSAAEFAQKPVCAGPYRLAERVPQDRIVLQRFEEYWDRAKIQPERLIYMPIPDAQVRATNLLAGQLDIVEQLSTNDLDKVRKTQGFQIASITGLNHFHLKFNVGNGERAKTPIGQNPRLREAFDLAIDRVALNQVVFGGAFVPGNQPVSPSSPFYVKSLPLAGRDVAKAKAIVQSMGGSAPSFTMLVTNAPVFLQVAETMQAMAKDAGIEVKIQAAEAATAQATSTKGDFDAFLAFWSGRADPDGNIFPYLGCKGSQNDGRYCNAEVDKLLDAAAATNDQQGRYAAYEKAAQIYLAERPTLFLYHWNWFWGMTSKVSGFIPVPDGIIRVKGVRLG